MCPRERLLSSWSNRGIGGFREKATSGGPVTNNDPVNNTDPYGKESYVVARPLNSVVGKLGFGHAFVVSNAKYIGDPNATVHSFGKLANGNMGNVSDENRAADASRTTFKSDTNAWLSLDADATENISQIDAPDDLVDAVAASVLENRPYDLAPTDSETVTHRPSGSVISTPQTNSNSGAFAVGDTSQQLATGDPNSQVNREPFTLTLPGEGASRKVEFKDALSSQYRRGSHIKRREEK